MANPGSTGVHHMPRPTAPMPSAGKSAAGGVVGGALGGLATGGPWAAAIGAGSALASAALGNKGAKNAAKTQQKAAAEALAYQREQDAKEEARYREQQAKLEAQWNAEQSRLAPYRQAAEALLGQNAGRLGLPFSPSAPPRSMPQGWTPGAAAVPRTLSQLAGTGTRGEAPVFDVPPVQAPQMSISDVLNSRWGARS